MNAVRGIRLESLRRSYALSVFSKSTQLITMDVRAGTRFHRRNRLLNILKHLASFCLLGPSLPRKIF